MANEVEDKPCACCKTVKRIKVIETTCNPCKDREPVDAMSQWMCLHGLIGLNLADYVAPTGPAGRARDPFIVPMGAYRQPG